MHKLSWLIPLLVILQSNTRSSSGFAHPKCYSGTGRIPLKLSAEEEERSASVESLKEEAGKLLARAQTLRGEIPTDRNADDASAANPAVMSSSLPSPWKVHAGQDGGLIPPGQDYRLYVDVGREPGTWMDPRWGASGRRIEFTLDVRFVEDGVATDRTIQKKMVKDNFGGKSSPTYALVSAKYARLRNGFEKMQCFSGGYRIDSAGRGGTTGTMRFYVGVEGTEGSSSYGDIFIPQGCLYFSLPVFGNSMGKLSTKEGPVTVRQIGWHTGWRREESRIIGTFRAVPLAKAIKRDSF